MEINLEAYNFFIKPGITDMRKGSPSLAYIVQNEMKLEPFSKAVFLFCGGTKRTIKAIVYRFELYPGVRLQKSSAVDFQQIGLR